MELPLSNLLFLLLAIPVVLLSVIIDIVLTWRKRRAAKRLFRANH